MISFLSCMGIVLEMVVTDLLSNTVTKRVLLHDCQLGSRHTRLAMKAVAVMVDIGHATWYEGNIMGVHQVDIMQVYPMLARGLLIHAMKSESLHGDLQKLTHSMLTVMTFKMVSAGIVLPRWKDSYHSAQQHL